MFRTFFNLFLITTGFVKCQQRQHFLATPVPTEVTEGEQAVLQCQVGDRIGQVQWTKDGLTLGFDRHLPGFDRYFVLGDEKSGEYNLQVVNATKEDEAKYECQVGPGRGNPPIRASAFLTVNLPPTSIQILNHLSGSRIEIKENEEVEIACKVSNAKPKARIIWYRNNVAFNPGLGNIEESSEEGTLADRKTSFSKIKFRPNSADNQATYACEAKHPALRGNPGRPATPMRASVLLSVLYPPEKPEIQGYITGETIRMGQTVSLVCQSFGGNPLASIVWFKNNQRIDHSYTTSGTKSKNTYMFLAQPEDNNAVFRCEANNMMLKHPLIAETTLSVQFAPDRVEILGPETAKVGQTLNFECAASNSNPASTILWEVDGTMNKAFNNVTRVSEEGGWVTNSDISVNIGPNDKTKTISCFAKNAALGETKVETHIVTVLYPPEELSITGYKPGDVLKEGSLRRIKCTSLSGNPLPQLEWAAGNQKVEGAQIEKSESGTFVSSEISIKVDRVDNGRMYRCSAQNKATQRPVTKSVQLLVTFPPTKVEIESEPQHPVEGSTAMLRCTSDSSLPQVEMIWYRDNEIMEPGGETGTLPSNFGGVVTSSVIRVPVTEDSIHSIYKCEARHKQTTKSVFGTLKIEAQYKPQFIDAIKEINFEVNSSNVFTINAAASPEITKYSWTKKGEREIPEIRDQRISSSGPNLYFNKVREEDAGTYIVVAENRIGKSRKNIRVNVEYPPRFSHVTRQVLVSQGEKAILTCNVEAYPRGPETIKWKREGYDLASRGLVETTVNGSVLTLNNVSLSDAGVFVCLAHNGIPRDRPVTIREKIYLLVNHVPVIDESPTLSKGAALGAGDVGVLTCRAKTGAPNVTFKWFREGREITRDSQSKYQIIDKNLDPLTWQSQLSVADIQMKDFGPYGCVAENSLGSNRHTVILVMTSKPETPLGLNVLSTTYNSVMLSWQPGFDGGFKQYFRIRWKEVGSSDPFQYTENIPSDATDYELPNLQVDTLYSFSIMAFNKLGESSHSLQTVQAKTAKVDKSEPIKPTPSPPKSGLISSGNILGIIATVGGALFICNLCLLYCYVKRRAGKHLFGGSSRSSSKSATIEMYVGNSSCYNESMSAGETLSSLSDKSEHFFSQEHHGMHHLEADMSPTMVRLHSNGYILDHPSNNIYDGSLPPVTSCVYGTLPRPLPASHCYTFQEDLTRQRSVANIEPAPTFSSSIFSKVPSLHNSQDPSNPVLYVAPSTSSVSTTQQHAARPSSPHEDLPPPPPPPHVLQYQCNDYQNIHLRPLPKPVTKPLRSQRIAKV